MKKITLPGGKKQQSISQYVDDSSFMVRGEMRYVDELVRLLKVFISSLHPYLLINLQYIRDKQKDLIIRNVTILHSNIQNQLCSYAIL